MKIFCLKEKGLKNSLPEASCRDHNLDEFNTGTYLNDQLLQNSIKKSKQYFDFLKGEEKYKFNFGGEVHQLYDLKIKV